MRNFKLKLSVRRKCQSKAKERESEHSQWKTFHIEAHDDEWSWNFSEESSFHFQFSFLIFSRCQQKVAVRLFFFISWLSSLFSIEEKLASWLCSCCSCSLDTHRTLISYHPSTLIWVVACRSVAERVVHSKCDVLGEILSLFQLFLAFEDFPLRWCFSLRFHLSSALSRALWRGELSAEDPYEQSWGFFPLIIIDESGK